MQNCRRDLRLPLLGAGRWISSGQRRYVSIYCEDKTLTAAGDLRTVPAASRAEVDRCDRAASNSSKNIFRVPVLGESQSLSFRRSVNSVVDAAGVSIRCRQAIREVRSDDGGVSFARVGRIPITSPPGDPSSLKLVGRWNPPVLRSEGYMRGFNSCPKSGASAPEAITGDTSPHAGLAFARECAQLSNACSHTRTPDGRMG